MLFIKNGPDIPERLLQAHEEGRVVFFCGAGISYPAGLRDFGWLADALYERLGVTPNPVQQAALKANQYDTAISLLEGDHSGGRLVVRKELAAILTPSDDSTKATATHEALLTLGKCRNGKLRLVTTNFDRLFEVVIARKGLTVDTFQAPLLPVPKNRWDGLVYLHGLLSPAPRDSELECLVVSSGDFGLAYLTERWAARFVSELFRNYTVCFVGYSLNDPVLRYMMDALAADRQRGESPFEMYAFGSFTKGKETDCKAEWAAKNVTPILYRHTKDHRYLHKTLQRWSETYRDGVRGKELIVVKEAIANPLITTIEDDFVGRVLWALSDESGLPAKRFADLDPVPSLDWLDPLSESRYRHGDLGRFRVPPKAEQDDKLRFSFIRRPSPYDRAPWITLVDGGAGRSGFDEPMRHLARWLTRHLDDPKLVLWLAKHGGQLHDDLACWVEHRLDEIDKLIHEDNNTELERIRASAPSAIPRPMLRTVWRMLLSGRVKSHFRDFDLYRWQEVFKREGLTASLRLAFRELLTPCVELREPFRWDEGTGEAGEEERPQRLKEIVDWELKLRTDYAHSTLRDIPNSAEWQVALADLLPDLNLLLRDALELMSELGGANERSDLSYLHQPSISEHPQNRDFHDWTALVGLTRDAWLALSRGSQEQARLVAQQWQQVPYPLFKRLAFFAAAQESIIPPPLAIDWLLADEHWWLWSVETERETLRLLVALAPRLNPVELSRLEMAILAGPPRAMFKDEITSEDWNRIIDREVWLRLAKMRAAGAALAPQAEAAMNERSAKYPQWKLAEDERDEFPFWMGDGEDLRKFVATPRRRRELVEWLKQHPHTDHWQEDDWRQRCRDEFGTMGCALYALTLEGLWPLDRWREALQAWAEEKLLTRSWRYMAPVISNAPDEVIGALAHNLSWWLQALAKSFAHHQDLFFSLCLRVLGQAYQEDGVDTDEPVTRAINHPVGHVTEALLRWWYRRELEDGQGLPDELSPIFTRLCGPEKSAYRHARVLLAAHAIALFRADPEWAKQNLLPHFDWHTSVVEARAVWEGFLWSPRLYRPLYELIKPAFLDTAKHYAELGKHARQYAALLTFAALEPRDTFTTGELKSATEALPEEGRQEAAQALMRALEGSGEQRAQYWHNRILPYWKSIWPKSRDYRTRALSEILARLCIAAREAFPEAIEVLRPWLQPVEHPDYIVRRLDQEGLAKRYPAAALEFLDTLIGAHAQWPPRNLGKCLGDIKSVDSSLEEDVRFQRMMEYVRQHDRN